MTMNKVMANKAKTAKAAVKKLPKEVSVEAAAEAKLVAENGDHAQGGFSTNVVASDDNSGGSSGGSGISPVVILGGLAAVGGIAAAAAGGGGEKTIVQPVPTPVPAPTPAPVPAPTYAVAADKTAADEGTTIRFTISGTNAAGKVVSYQLTGSAATAADVSSPLTGTVTLDSNGKAYVDVVVSADKLTEGAEKLNLVLSGGEKVAADVTINDTSLTPAPTAQTFTLTTGVDAGTDFTGTTADDKYNASSATLGSLDVLDGAAGSDTLTVTDAGAVASLGGATISGIENLAISAGGAIGAIKAVAGVDTAGQFQVRTLVAKGQWTAGDTITVKINGVEYTATVGTVSGDGRAEALDAIRSVLNAHLGDTVTVAATSSAGSGTSVSTTMTVTAAGDWVLPTITVAKKAYASTSTDASMAFSTAASATATSTDGAISTVAGVTQTAAAAVAQKEVVTIGTTTSATKIILSVGGSDYSATFTATSTASDVATQLASLVNSVLGAGSATASSTSVTITALKAGTALPAMNVQVLNASGASAAADTWVHSVSNVAANTVATASAAVAAPTDVTAYTATATGAANVSAGATSTITVTGTAVQTSGGSDVKVTASDSVFVSGAKGAVTVKTGATETTLYGAVAADTATGVAGDAAGVYVTGGTTVTITGSNTTGAVKVGAAAYAKDAVNATGGLPQSNGSASKDPTGDVSVSRVKAAANLTTGLLESTFSTSEAKIYMNGGTTATVKGVGDATIVDVNTLSLVGADGVAAVGTSKLATVNLAGLSGTANITSDAISTVAVSDSRVTATVNVLGTTGANTGTINYVLSNVGSTSTRVTLADATAATINVKSGAESTYTGSMNVGSASYVTLSGAKATAINLSNSLAVDLGDVRASTAKVTKVDGSTATGSIVLTLAETATLEGGFSLTTGSGKDTVTLASGVSLSANSITAATTKIDLGAGDDTILNGGSTHTLVGATINGGAGTDTVAASLLTSGNAAQFTGFEVLGLDVTGATASFDAGLLSSATGLSLLATGTSGQTTTYSNVKLAQSLTVGADVAADANIVLDFGAANVVGTADAYAITFNGVGSLAPTTAVGIDAAIVKIAGVEKVTVNSGSATGYTSNTINLIDADATSLTLTGSQDLDVDFGASDSDDTGVLFGTGSQSAVDGLGVALIDASAMTGKLNIDTTDVGVAFAGLTVKGGSAADTVTLAQAATVNLGAGDDKVVASSAGGEFTGGAGKDTFDVDAALYGSTGVISTITDLAAGDKIDVVTAGTGAVLGAKVDVSAATTLLAAIELANGSSTSAANGVTWFQYGGNTYVVDDQSTSASVGTTDLIVKLTGTLDLSTSVLSSGLITFG